MAKTSQELRALERARMDAYIEQRGDVCEICQDTYPIAIYEFHHVDPSNKLKGLGANKWTKHQGAPGGGTWKEADKCAILCANCHRLEHIMLRKGQTLFGPDYCTPDGSTPVTKPHE